VTDPNTPPLDPVEDRVRRTFAARTEDMAPGDSAGAPPDLGRDGRAAPRRLRGTRRPVLAAAVVVVVAGATAGVTLVARDGDREAGRLTTVAEQPPPSKADVAAVTAPRTLVNALQDERNLAATTLMGIEEAIALPVTDTAQARSDTDAAVATFAAFVAASPDGAAYQPGLDGLGALDELRRDIDSHAGPRSLDNVDTARDVFDRYAGIVGGLLDDQQAHAETIDDPVVRTGAIAYARGLRLGEQTTQLIRISLMAVVLPGTESVAELGRLQTEVQQGLDTLVAETAGTPFAEAAVTVVREVEEAGLLEAAGRAMDGTGDVSVIVGAADLLEDQGWPAFLDRVEETLAAGS
jgi:Nitrate and nitrite sensing